VIFHRVAAAAPSLDFIDNALSVFFPDRVGDDGMSTARRKQLCGDLSQSARSSNDQSMLARKLIAVYHGGHLLHSYLGHRRVARECFHPSANPKASNIHLQQPETFVDTRNEVLKRRW